MRQGLPSTFLTPSTPWPCSPEAQEAGFIFCQLQQLSNVKSAELWRHSSSIQTHKISAAGLLNLSWPWINHFVSPTHNVIGIHMKNLPRAFSWNQKGLKVFLEAKNMKGHNLRFNIHSEVTQGDRFIFCILSRLKCNAAQYVVSLIRMKHAFSQQNLCCHHPHFSPFKPSVECNMFTTVLLWGLLTGILWVMGSRNWCRLRTTKSA